MLQVGITGQSGFMGTHLFNYLNLFKDQFSIHPFKDAYFEDQEVLKNWVKKCDVIVHLAALNRHNDPDEIYNTNLNLVKQLIRAMTETNSTPHILFSSSTQEERDNQYGRSKRAGRKLFLEWAEKSGAIFTGLVIPNVFGPFGNPYYNSVVATFSHQLTHNESPMIEIDGELKLIYINELTEIIRRCIVERTSTAEFKVKHTSSVKVSDLLAQLSCYKEEYFEQGIIPALADDFERNLFNTFRSYIDISSFNPFSLTMHGDDRGNFVEVIRMKLGGQVSFSTTKPGITRGNHFHSRKIERFIVLKGEALIQLRRIGTDELIEFVLKGDSPAFVDMPVWYTHNIKNIGKEDLYTLFWINEFYNNEDPDTYFEEV